MSEFGQYDDEFENDFEFEEDQRETPAEAVARLRAELEAGESHVRPELAEAIMQHAHNTMMQDKLVDAIPLVDEALVLIMPLFEEEQSGYLASVARCMLFRALMIRAYEGARDGLDAFNKLICFLLEHQCPGETSGQNELAIALMNKAEILVDPLGAYAAAIANQSQAVSIWKRLIEDGHPELLHQTVSALLALSDSKSHMGDLDAALTDLLEAVALIRGGIEFDRNSEMEGIFVHSLLKLTQVLGRLGNIAAAFHSCHEAIGILENTQKTRNGQIELNLSVFYMERASLFERVGDSALALEDYQRSRDIHVQLIDKGHLTSPGDYLIRTGLANTLMCCGNMLADLKRFEEAMETFEESIQRYQEADELWPENERDETRCAYSISVVRLNQANMLAGLGHYAEALALKEEAILTLRQRLEGGHGEIVSNLVSAYRRAIDILHRLGRHDEMHEKFEDVLGILETAVDEGGLEHRNHLAATYHHRAMLRGREEPTELVEKDILRALRVFRELADDNIMSQENHWAKMRWMDMMESLARHFIRHERIDDAFRVFQKGLDDAILLYAEGNPLMLFDIMFGYSRFVQFVDSQLREIMDRHTAENVRRWTQLGLDGACSAMELLRRQRTNAENNRDADLFFRTKIAFFRRYSGTFLQLQEKHQEAFMEYATAAIEWDTLIEDAQKLLLEKEYYDKENAAEKAAENEHDPDLSEEGGEGTKTSTEKEDPCSERWKYCVSELRQTLQSWIPTCIKLGHPDHAEQLFQRELDLSRDMIRRDISDGDRFLILSMTTYAKDLESIGCTEKTLSLHEEAATLIRTRLGRGGAVSVDFELFKHVFLSFMTSLRQTGEAQREKGCVQHYIETLETCPVFPDPEIWIDLCDLLRSRDLQSEDKDIETIRLALLARHPQYQDAPESP